MRAVVMVVGVVDVVDCVFGLSYKYLRLSPLPMNLNSIFLKLVFDEA